MLNLIHCLLSTNQINQVVVHRVTRQNVAPVLQQYVPQNDIIGKLPVLAARNYWNNLPADIRNINGHEQFKNIIRTMVKNEYVREEMAKLTAGQFI